MAMSNLTNTFTIVIPPADSTAVINPNPQPSPMPGSYQHAGSNIDTPGYASFKALDKGSRY